MDFEKLRDEGFDMYENLMSDCKNEAEITKLNWADLRDSFRQHVNNRRNQTNDSLIMDYYSIRNIVKLKTELLDLMDKFEDLKNSNRQKSSKEETGKKFANFTTLMKFAVNNEEILQSEKWKLKKVYEALESFKEELMSGEETVVHPK